MTKGQDHERAGLILGLAAYVLWGVMPLFFQTLGHVPSTEVVAHRALWSLVLLAALLSLWRRWGALVAIMRQPRLLAALLTAAAVIGCNWLVFIWAVTNGHVLETSLGYYLNPLVNVLLGVFLLKERLTRRQLSAVLLAGAGVGVAVMATGAAQWLWISLVLAASFAFYGLIRKLTPVGPIEGLAVETALLAPIGLAWLLWREAAGAGAFGTDRSTDVLLILTGVATAAPLLLFTAAARRLPLSTLGFLQYVAPSLQFLVAVWGGEKLTLAHMLCFGAIWTALLLFAVDGLRSGRVPGGTTPPE